MPAPSTADEFLELVKKSGVLDDKKLDAYVGRLRAAGALPSRPNELAGCLLRDGLLTHFQAEQFLMGKWRRFTIGKYKVLEKLGSGGMGSVYLCEHKLMRRRVAVKVLPTARAEDPSALERFYREARVVAALDHPNIVRAYDIDQDEKLHFLVMEYVDGTSLQEVVKRSGPLSPVRTAHYVRQAAMGLQHAHETAGIVHRDIKPGNVLVDRGGTVKVLDMGLARFFHDEEDVLTKKYDENVLGTADYLAPEQALDSHTVDIRADIYSLGATGYYCLTGRTPFSEGTVAQKLIWHQTRQPKPIRSFRQDVPEGLIAVLERMMAKDPGQRYGTPRAVAEALAPLTQTPIPPPPDAEMPRLSLAATGGAPTMSDSNPASPAPAYPGTPSSGQRRTWQVASSPPSPRPLSGPLEPPSGAPTQPTRPSQQTPPASPPRPSAPAPVPQPTLVATPNGLHRPAPAPAPAPALEPAAEEEGDPWEKLSPDTDDPTARADTAPRSGPHAAPSSRSARLTLAARVRQRAWWEIVLVALFAFMLLGLAGTVLTGIIRGLLAGKPAAPVATVRTPETLFVNRTGGGFTQLRDAVRKARPGDRIIIQEPGIDETIALTDSLGKGFTIEGEKDKSVVWRAPVNPADLNPPPLLNVEGAQDVHVRNLILDGGDRLQNLVLLQGRCAGTSLENVELRGFKRCAVLVMNCEGEAERPVLLSRLHTVTAQEAEAGLLFDANPKLLIKLNQFLRVQDCRFEGPYKMPVQVIRDTKQIDLAGKNVHVLNGNETPVQLPR
jgi:serine/threonine protein kinase